MEMVISSCPTAGTQPSFIQSEALTVPAKIRIAMAQIQRETNSHVELLKFLVTMETHRETIFSKEKFSFAQVLA